MRLKPQHLKALKIGAYGFVCTAALLLGAGLRWLSVSPTLVSIVKNTLTQTTPEEIFSRDQLTFLVLGCDEDRYYGGKQILKTQARSDTILLVRVDFKNKRVGGISIPRDLQVGLPSYSARKINAYHAIGGKDLAKQAVESVTGIPIDRVMTLDYTAFQEMVNLVGGVEVFIPKRMKYIDKAGGLFIDLTPGMHKLNGYDAMCFVRFRHSDSDFMRIERQRDFMLAFKQAVKGQLSVFPQVVNKGSEVLGNSFTPDEMAGLAMFLKDVPSENIKMGTLPVTDGPGSNLLLISEQLDETLTENYILPKFSKL